MVDVLLDIETDDDGREWVITFRDAGPVRMTREDVEKLVDLATVRLIEGDTSL